MYSKFICSILFIILVVKTKSVFSENGTETTTTPTPPAQPTAQPTAQPGDGKDKDAGGGVPKDKDKPDTGGKAPDAGGSGGPSPNTTYSGPRKFRKRSNYTEEDSRENPVIHEAVLKMEKLHCDSLYSECTHHKTKIHPHIKKSKIESKCLMQTKGYLICEDYSKTDADKAPALAPPAVADPSTTETPTV